MQDRLAIAGGQPVAEGLSWPAWPSYDAGTETALVAALRSRRWAVSWASAGEPSRERQFAEAFAAYNGTAHCVSVDHGSSALVVALEALGVGPGDEVVVPAVTWVAPITAVLRVGALPVIVDVDPASGCIDVERVRDELGSPRVKAVVAVHLACTVADVSALRQLADDRGIGFIEDCAQAHGAEVTGQRVGTFGDIGAFSFQAGKVLAAGEGGAVITSRPELNARMLELRADSRRYVSAPALAGEEELEVSGLVMGANYCMSEWSAAVLLDRLGHLDEDHRRREEAAAAIEAGLAELPGAGTLARPSTLTKRSVYEYAIQFGVGSPLRDLDKAQVAAALSAELGFPVWQADQPLPRSVYFRPASKARFAWSEDADSRSRGRDYPGAEQYHRSTVLFHHRSLLGGPEHAAAIVAAVDKLYRNAGDLA
jgi:dTDP-4-amino-4,6-dideoxygalactose transaminase